jgi:hypothetical protein
MAAVTRYGSLFHQPFGIAVIWKGFPHHFSHWSSSTSASTAIDDRFHDRSHSSPFLKNSIYTSVRAYS